MIMKTIKDFSIQDLKDELKIREDEEAERIRIEKETKTEQDRLKRVEKIKLAIKHRDVLKLFMKHCRTSCDNGKQFNAFYHPKHNNAECNLCCFENLEEWDDDIEIDVDITLRRIQI